MNFMIAGRDTTACGLSWTLFELGKFEDARADVEKLGADDAAAEKLLEKIAAAEREGAVV